MKRYLLTILILLTIITLLPKYQIEASEPNIVENLLEIKSITYQTRKYTINQTITVEKGEKYTLFFDRSIFGENFEHLINEDYGVTIFYNMFFYDKVEVSDHEYGHYVEFIPTMNIQKIFLKTWNATPTMYPLFMLYKGDYNEFTGFNNYLNDNQSLIVDEVLIYLTKKDNFILIGDIVDKIEIISTYEDLEIVIYKDEYTPNQEQEGLYDLEIHLNDKNSNLLKIIKYKIKVLDYIIPYIDGPDEVVLYRNENTSLYDILEQYQYQVIDNGIHPQALYIESDDWNKDYAGSYQARIFATDLEGNEIEKYITVILIDNTSPKIVKNADIIYSYNNLSPLTEEDILTSFEISDDDLFKNLTITLSNYDYYLENSMFEDDYEVLIEVKDLSGNISNSNIIIRVIKQKTITVKPDVRFFLTLEEANTMTLKEIEDWFINQLVQFDITAKNLEILFTDYELNSKLGNYYMDILYNVGEEQIRERVMINIEPAKSKKPSPYLIGIIILSAILVTTIPCYFIYHKKIKYKKHQ